MATKFAAYLNQTFKQLREARAKQLIDSTELKYRRTIEDMCIKIQDLDQKTESLLLDLCPHSTMTTQVGPSDYSPEAYVDKDLKIGFDRRQKTVELAVAVDRYEELFGPYKQADQIKELIPTWESKIPKEEPKNS